jgi:hypothetical protein
MVLSIHFTVGFDEELNRIGEVLPRLFDRFPLRDRAGQFLGAGDKATLFRDLEDCGEIVSHRWLPSRYSGNESVSPQPISSRHSIIVSKSPGKQTGRTGSSYTPAMGESYAFKIKTNDPRFTYTCQLCGATEDGGPTGDPGLYDRMRTHLRDGDCVSDARQLEPTAPIDDRNGVVGVSFVRESSFDRRYAALPRGGQ